jgi:proteasome lid subunit RPN8/RPN11
LRISRSLLDEMVAHALEQAPDECCGMVAARDGEAVRVHRVRNAKASPLAYELDGLEQMHVEEEIEEAGLDMAAIYHSHTRSAPIPSQTDINLASPFYDHVLYVIVGVQDRAAPEVRAYRIVDRQVSEEALEVV